ncbi:MAG: hypothetical protein CMQ20_03750 [Gammaproteobacteria bacterium]|nr:hypothetical protein [Gammaproteobacteria bacterium]|tara:strand:+ start:193 stop:579 length:387 start_codon:yes stop_codon:yes gene_type:complete
MVNIKSLLSILLTCTIVFSNTICVCTASAASEMSQPDHHSSPEQSMPAQSDCQHKDCLKDCFDTAAWLPDRDTGLLATFTTGTDDDDWDLLESDFISPPGITAAISLLPKPMLVASSTPVRRYDLLLE